MACARCGDRNWTDKFFPICDRCQPCPVCSGTGIVTTAVFQPALKQTMPVAVSCVRCGGRRWIRKEIPETGQSRGSLKQ